MKLEEAYQRGKAEKVGYDDKDGYARFTHLPNNKYPKYIYQDNEDNLWMIEEGVVVE